MSFQLNIQQFKCFARFGLMHIVATNICVWIRTVFKVDFEKATKAIITNRHFSGGNKGHRCLQSGQRRRCLWGLYDQRFLFPNVFLFWKHGGIFYFCQRMLDGEKFWANYVSRLCLFLSLFLLRKETKQDERLCCLTFPFHVLHCQPTPWRFARSCCILFLLGF